MKKIAIILISSIFILVLTIQFGNSVFIMFENNLPSESIGSTNNGSLINEKRLPSNGDNFVTYSYFGSLLGRNSVHGQVRKIILKTYQKIYKEHPEKKFVYGETGWQSGGPLPPHRTHQNGLSVDFIVPILNEDNVSVPLPTSIFNKFGYNIDFDLNGNYEDYKIDFEIMATHIYYLLKFSLENGMDIWRVIFDPKLQPHLFNTEYGRKIKDKIQFSKKRSWVRHDEHYHIDFKFIDN